MSLVITDLELQNQLNTKPGLSDFLLHIAGKVQVWGETSACIIRQPDVAKELKISLSSAKRYLNELEQKGVISKESKRGNNGGTIVTFNRKVLEFSVTPNVITDTTKKAEELREKYFPRRPEPKTRYRTKAEIARDRALAKINNDKSARLNDILDELPFPNLQFFQEFDNPDLALEAYLISRMFNAYALIFPYERYILYKDTDARMANRAKRTFKNASTYDVLGERFVGTPRWKKFEELAQYCRDEEINPLAYLTCQFKYIDYRETINKPIGPVPFCNTLVTEDSKQRYLNDEKFYSKVRRKNMFLDYTGKVLFLGAKYPIIQALHMAYTLGTVVERPLDHIIQEIEEASFNSDRAEKLLSYYMNVSLELKASDITEENKKVIARFLKEQVALYSNTTTLSDSDYLLACNIPLQHMKTLGGLNKVPQKDYHFYMGNKEKKQRVTAREYELFIKRGSLLDFSVSASKTFRGTLGLLSEHQGIGINPHKLNEALNSFGLEKVPLDTYGLLDIDKIL